MSITLRLQTRSGTKRLNADPCISLLDLKKQIESEFDVPVRDQLLSIRDQRGTGSRTLSEDSKTLKNHGLQHGDLLILMSPPTAMDIDEEPSPSPSQKALSIGKKGTIVADDSLDEKEIIEDEVDRVLRETDGWINRKDPKKVMASTDDYVAPWCILSHSPWKEQKIKHLPFHSVVAESKYRSGSNTVPQITEESFRMKKEKTVTSKQIVNSTATITRQNFRHVDHVLFEHRQVVDQFIEGWRRSGLQRGGYLIGKYEADETIPLGIQATVKGIYEPPQSSRADGVFLLKDHNVEKVDDLLNKMGLQRIGFIWTHLEVNDAKQLVNNREPDTPLTQSEMVRMARLQQRYPSPWKNSRSGKYGSKFVSVLVRGNEDEGVELEAFQISNQGAALMNEGIIRPSKKDDKNFRVTKPKSSSKYVYPDLLYADRDEYNNAVIKKADPYIPSVFFLIGVRHGFPKDAYPSFKAFLFPSLNRNEPPSWNDVKQQIEGHTGSAFFGVLTDFQLMLFFLSEGEDELLQTLVEVYKADGDIAKMPEQEGVLKKRILNTVRKHAPAAPSSTAASTNPTAPAPDLDEELLNKVMLMGFSSEQAQEAVFATGGTSVETAINYILNNS